MVRLVGPEDFETENKDTAKDDEKKTIYLWEIVWINVILLGLLHIGAFYSLFIRSTTLWSTCILGKFMGFSTTLGITGGAHRLWSHKSYKANTFVQCLLMFLATCTYQNSVYVWARDHRVHHKYTETDADPHNAKRGFFFSHVGWLLVRKHPDVLEKGKSVDMSDLRANRIVMFQHKFYYPLVFLGTVALPMCICYYGFGENLRNAFFIPVVYRYVVSVNVTWCINSLNHLYGSKPYNTRINPTENLIMQHFGFGEGFHNYHHTFPWDYKAGEFNSNSKNMTASMIDTFSQFGWVTDRKTAPLESIQKYKNEMGDGTIMKKPNTWQRIRDFVLLMSAVALI